MEWTAMMDAPMITQADRRKIPRLSDAAKTLSFGHTRLHQVSPGSGFRIPVTNADQHVIIIQ